MSEHGSSTFSSTFSKQQSIAIAMLLNAQADPIVIFVILKLYGIDVHFYCYLHSLYSSTVV